MVDDSEIKIRPINDFKKEIESFNLNKHTNTDFWIVSGVPIEREVCIGVEVTAIVEKVITTPRETYHVYQRLLVEIQTINRTFTLVNVSATSKEFY